MYECVSNGLTQPQIKAQQWKEFYTNGHTHKYTAMVALLTSSKRHTSDRNCARGRNEIQTHMYVFNCAEDFVANAKTLHNSHDHKRICRYVIKFRCYKHTYQVIMTMFAPLRWCMHIYCVIVSDLKYSSIFKILCIYYRS